MLTLLKAQIQIKKKVLNQVVHIPFTVSRKQRSISEITQELSDLIDTNTNASKYSHFIKDPKALVGHQIEQKFIMVIKCNCKFAEFMHQHINSRVFLISC